MSKIYESKINARIPYFSNIDLLHVKLHFLLM